MSIIENQFFQCSLHPKGAAVARLLYKPKDCDVALGLRDDTARVYTGHYLGTIVGPVANRIGNGHFCLDDKDYRLDQNEGAHTLHGGKFGFSEVLWQVTEQSATSMSFQHIMPDGHMGFPGSLACTVRYSLSGAALVVTMTATSDNRVVVNMSPHIYWNLLGSGDIARHKLQIPARTYLRLNNDGIPTGEIASVEGTPLDFQQECVIADRAFDHHLCIAGQGLRKLLRLSAPNGLVMEVHSNQAGVQIYDGRHFGNTGLIGRDGTPLINRGGIAIEPQGYPDAPNHAHFPSVLLEPHTLYKHRSEFHFIACTA